MRLITASLASLWERPLHDLGYYLLCNVSDSEGDLLRLTELLALDNLLGLPHYPALNFSAAGVSELGTRVMISATVPLSSPQRVDSSQCRSWLCRVAGWSSSTQTLPE